VCVCVCVCVCVSDQYISPLHDSSTEPILAGGTIRNALYWLLTAFGDINIYSVLCTWLSLNLAEICTGWIYRSYTASNICEKVIAILIYGRNIFLWFWLWTVHNPCLQDRKSVGDAILSPSLVSSTCITLFGQRKY
jgi:hypothetical protein